MCLSNMKTKRVSDLCLSVDGVFELDEGKALVDPESPALNKMLRAGWFTWDEDEDGNLVMTCIEGALDLQDIFEVEL